MPRILTDEYLTTLWKRYWKEGHDANLRFGQFVFNESGFEYLNSYQLQNAYEAYTIIRQGLEW